VNQKIAAYIALLQQALTISEGVYTIVRDAIAPFAQTDLTPQQYAELEDRWHVDAIRAAANAGIDAATGRPFFP
jgi:hypothetical protein